MLISQGNIKAGALSGKVALVTGAGGGIGFEAARALLWLGCRAVIIAEIDKTSGKSAARALQAEFGSGKARFVHCDVGREDHIRRLQRKGFKSFGQVDIVINNATVAPLGAVVDTPVDAWDRSYRVNLRGPVLLARAFIPEMVSRGEGVFMCVSSQGQEFMAAYEALKAAQVHLGSTLDAELGENGVSVFTIGPGFVPTRTALDSVPQLAGWMGKSMDEMQAILAQYTISVEAAAAGFAAAAVMADRYRGQEISSYQALVDAGIDPQTEKEPQTYTIRLDAARFAQALQLCKTVRTTLAEQSAGWEERSVFERQWMIRNFRKVAGMPVSGWLETLERLETYLAAEDTAGLAEMRLPLGDLARYYANLYEMARSYGKDAQARAENLKIVAGWQTDVEELQDILTGGSGQQQE